MGDVVIKTMLNGTLSSVTWTNDVGLRHCLNGPAVINYLPSGELVTTQYFLHGLRHCITGPAYRFHKGKATHVYGFPDEYYIRGISIDKEVFDIMSELEYESPEWEFTWEML